MNLKIHRSALLEILERLMPIVPTRPLNPIEGQLRIVAAGPHVIAEATDGRIRAQVVSNHSSVEGDDFDIFPAARLNEFVKFLPSTDLSIYVDGRMSEIRADVVEDYKAMFTLPLLPDKSLFPPFPELGSLIAVFKTAELKDGIDRVQFAMGGPATRDENRMIQILDGRVSAFSGSRAQDVVLGSGEQNGEVLLVDFVVEPILRFLGHGSTEDHVTMVHVTADPDSPLQYVFSTALPEEHEKPDGIVNRFVCTVPVAKFADLSNVRRIANDQMKKSGHIEAPRQLFLQAIHAARLQARPDDLSVNFDLTQPVRVHSATDGDNKFETFLPDSTYTGAKGNVEDGRTITASIDDLLGLISSDPGERLNLFVAPASFAQGSLMPMIQTKLESKEGTLASGIIAQKNS